MEQLGEYGRPAIEALIIVEIIRSIVDVERPVEGEVGEQAVTAAALTLDPIDQIPAQSGLVSGLVLWGTDPESPPGQPVSLQRRGEAVDVTREDVTDYMT